MYFEKKDRGAPPCIGNYEVAERHSAEIVIIGGGHAGTQCALAAAEKGLSVLVIERRPQEKMGWFGEQIAAYNSKYHIEHGFGPYDTDEITAELYRCSSYLANPVIIEKFVKNSGEMIDNMMSLLPENSTLLDDSQFNIQKGWGEQTYPMTVGGHKTWAATMIFRGPVLEEHGGPEYKYPERCSDYMVNERSRLPEFEMLALKRSQELGARWHFGTSAVLLRQNEAGAVTGVVAKRRDGSYAEFSAGRAVVLSSGDFSSTGLDLGLWAGGFSELVTNLKMPLSHIRHGFGCAPFLALNRDGKRFMDESIPYAIPFALEQQPDGLITSVTDAKFFEQIKRCGLQHGNADFGRPEYVRQSLEDFSHVLEAGPTGYPVRDMNTSEREKHRLYAAESLETLAGYLGYTGEAKKQMLASVARYNEMCRAGRDTDFRKDPNTLLAIDCPPYYGVRDTIKRENRTGGDTPLGLVTDNDFNVLKPNGDPIPGLYAAGNCLGRRFGNYYPTPSGGQYVGSAMTTGRVLGKYLAALK